MVYLQKLNYDEVRQETKKNQIDVQYVSKICIMVVS